MDGNGEGEGNRKGTRTSPRSVTLTELLPSLASLCLIMQNYSHDGKHMGRSERKRPTIDTGGCNPFSAKPYRGMVWETSEEVMDPAIENPYCDELLSFNVTTLMLSFSVTS